MGTEMIHNSSYLNFRDFHLVYHRQRLFIYYLFAFFWVGLKPAALFYELFFHIFYGIFFLCAL